MEKTTIKKQLSPLCMWIGKIYSRDVNGSAEEVGEVIESGQLNTWEVKVGVWPSNGLLNLRTDWVLADKEMPVLAELTDANAAKYTVRIGEARITDTGVALDCQLRPVTASQILVTGVEYK